MRSLLLLILIVFCHATSAQNDSISELEIRKVLATELSDSLRVTYLLQLSDIIAEENIIEPRKINLQALALLNKMPQTNFNLKNKALVYDKLGVIERKSSNSSQALAYYFKALDIKEKIHDSINIGRSYHNIGMIFRFQKEYDKAKQYLNKAIALRKKLNDSTKLATSVNMYGVILARQKQKDSALYYYNLAKSLYTEKLDIASVNDNLAVMFTRVNEFEKAKAIYEENITFFREHNANYKLSRGLINLARIYNNTNQPNIAFNLIKEAEQIAKRNGYKDHLKGVYLLQYKIYRDKGRYKDALDNYRLYRKYKDSIHNIDRAKEIAIQEVNYKHQKEKLADSLQFANEKKELHLIASAAKSRNQFYFTMLLLAVAIIVSISLLMKRQKSINKERLEKKQLEKELLDERVKNTLFQTQKVMADKAMRLEFQEEFLSRIKKVSKVSTTKSPELNTLVSELQSQIQTEKKNEILEKNYTDIDVAFEKNLLKYYPNLTKSEREVCALMRLNLSLKEIMAIKNVSMPSIKSSRYRIRKKLGLEQGQELEQFIQNLFIDD